MQYTLEFRTVALWVVLAASSTACVGPTGGAAPASVARAAPVAAQTAPATTNESARSSAGDTAELAAQEQAAQDDELICRRETVVGSHLRERRCYTRAQREEMRRQAGELLEEEGRPLVFPGAE